MENPTFETANASALPAPKRLFAYAKHEINACWAYLKHPRYLRVSHPSNKERWSRIALFFAAMLLLDIVFTLTIGLALDKWATLDYLPDLGPAAFFFLAVLMAPLIEEMIFRAGLRTPVYSLYIGPVLIILVGGATPWQLSLVFITTILVLAFGAHLYIEQRKRERGMQTNFFVARQYLQHYPKVFWLYACGFSLVHIVNYGINDASGLLVVFAVIPQFIAGALWGYIRLRDGLMSSMVLHALGNFVPFVLIYGFGLDA